MVRNFAIIAIVVAIGALGGMWYVSRGGDDPLAQCRTGAIGGGASAIGGPFELVDETGKTVTDKDVIDQPTLIYFGYTYCPDVCPMDTARNAEAVDVLEGRGVMVKPVFITIDPARDTPEQLLDFTDNLHDRMIGLTGSAAQVKAASQAYKTYYRKQDSDDPEFYLVDHSTFSYFVTPEAGFVDYFKRDETPEQMADRIQCFIENL